MPAFIGHQSAAAKVPKAFLVLAANRSNQSAHDGGACREQHTYLSCRQTLTVRELPQFAWSIEPKRLIAMTDTKVQLPSCEGQSQLNALFAAPRTGDKGREPASAAKELWLTATQCAELSALAHHLNTL